MTASARIKVLEWGLLLSGAALAVWCVMVLIQAHRYAVMPVPPAARTAAATLPDEHAISADTDTTAPNHAPAVPPGAWVARLEAPASGLTATILEGTDDGTLRRGAGHIEGTAWPGEQGNVGIAGHRDTTFRAVRRFRVGDPLILTSATTVARYRISNMSIVRPEDVYVLDPTDHGVLTLVTCYPFEFIGHAPKRYIVRADLEKETPR
jgi:LPXTG-site transpeptidase (sortase) family protein